VVFQQLHKTLANHAGRAEYSYGDLAGHLRYLQ
jgi:hypothetical protein